MILILFWRNPSYAKNYLPWIPEHKKECDMHYSLYGQLVGETKRPKTVKKDRYTKWNSLLGAIVNVHGQIYW